MKVLLTDTLTGVSLEIESDANFDDGNFSCDCNRAILLYPFSDIDCNEGHNRITVEKVG